jgi:hypothetical protein
MRKNRKTKSSKPKRNTGLSIVLEMKQLHRWLQSEWKSLHWKDRLHYKRELEYRLSLGLVPRAEQAVKNVLGLFKGI